MNKLFLRAALVSAAALAIASPSIANHSWGGYHWAGNGSNLALRMNTATTAQWETAIRDARTDWDNSNELTLTRYIASGVSTKKCSPVAGQILVCNDSYGQRGWLGIASIWLSNGHISQATTKLNDSYFNSSYYNTPAWRALVACQEIGHDFGLDHQDETFDNYNLGTCMDYTNAPDGGVVGGFNYGPANRHPNTHDYQELNIIYNHDDGFTTTIQSTMSTNFGIRMLNTGPQQRSLSSEGSGDSPAEWGRAIHADSLGRPNVFVKELGPGQRVLTHVLWAIGEGPRGRF